MREILFRAKRIDNGEWVEGFYVNQYGSHAIYLPNGVESEHTFDNYHVDPSTICQHTGLCDKNGRKIWENDILSIAKKSDGMGGYYFPPIPFRVNIFVRWDLCGWIWETIEERKHYIHFPDAWCHYEAEVIGNVFDNPELLEDKYGTTEI